MMMQKEIQIINKLTKNIFNEDGVNPHALTNTLMYLSYQLEKKVKELEAKM